MAKNKKSTKDTKTIENPPSEKVEVVESVVEETQPSVNIIDELSKSVNNSSLDANHRVELNGQIIDLFIKNPNATKMFGDKICATMTRIGAIGVISAVADEAINGNSTFAITVKREAYDNLRLAATDIGVTLPPISKLLPGKVDESVSLTSDDVKVSEETAKNIKEEKKIEKAGDNKEIELDPVKVAHMSEADLVNALTYLLVTGLKRNKSIKDSLVDTVDFMHAYRIELARQAENSTDAMNALEDRSMYEWLKDIFKYVKPITHLKGIGIGMHSLVAKEKSPLSAFIILRQAMLNKETGLPTWDDQSIADTVRAMVEMICMDHIAAETKNLEALDKNAKGYRKVAEKYEKAIDTEKEILQCLVDISFDLADKYNTPEGDKDTVMQSAYGRLLKMYYPQCTNRGGQYEGLNENLRQRAGIILNLFRTPGNYNLLYSVNNLTELKEISLEEYNKKLAEAKKAEAAAKKAETKKG